MITKRTFGRVAVAGLLGLFGMASGASAQEKEIPVADVPKAVTEAAKAKFPHAKVVEAASETEDGKTVYELGMTQGDKKMDVTFEANGTLVVVEAVIPEADAPAAVKTAVKAKYPGAKVDLIETVTKGPDLKDVADSYEFHLTTADKKTVEVELDAKGKILKSEEAKKDEKEKE